jgi:hypothetical protein
MIYLKKNIIKSFIRKINMIVLIIRKFIVLEIKFSEKKTKSILKINFVYYSKIEIKFFHKFFFNKDWINFEN